MKPRPKLRGIITPDETAMPEANESEAPAPGNEEAIILEIKTTDQPPTKDNMEVHHHAHHGHEKEKLEILFLGISNAVSRCVLRLPGRV